ncbi:MAG TPA: pyridoxine 5'-phosphate synthase [Vicinamibacterales bacterium]|nr:pyridoxine 5'-phosphate synthase [Vicinamibacterales bacterium]
MISLSVNVNKIATLRNSRGGNIPSVIEAVKTCVAAGAPGITVHPRLDQRHIRPGDVHEIAALLAHLTGPSGRRVEFNIEGDPGPELIDLVLSVQPTQCTLVPTTPGEITSHAGWAPDTPIDTIGAIVEKLHRAGIRVAVFVEPESAPIEWAARLGADRIELYTEPFAKAYERSPAEGRDVFSRYVRAAGLAHGLNLGVNAGHDLDLRNLALFKTLPHLDEVSIGHALISHAVWVGLERSVKDYLAAVE